MGLINGLMSTYWLWCRRDGLTPDNLEAVEAFVPLEHGEQCLWGEAAVIEFCGHQFNARRLSGLCGVRGKVSKLCALNLSAENWSGVPSVWKKPPDVSSHKVANDGMVRAVIARSLF
jgi:hypothetical protein